MAIRRIREEGDPILRKTSKEVSEINEKIISLLDDMRETMIKYEGMGLAAPQVGILKKIFIFDTGEEIIEMINPVILETEGEKEYIEGCLSVPGYYGKVKRPDKVVAEALNRDGEKFRIEGENEIAQVILHENDHLSGTLYIDKAYDLQKVTENSEMR